MVFQAFSSAPIHTTCPAHFILLDHPNYTGCGKLTSFFIYEYTHIKKEVSLPHPVLGKKRQVMKLLIMQHPVLTQTP
jgi:hypothetical protein